MACTITQADADFTGDCKTDQGAVKISGKLSDKTANWTLKTEYNGSPLTLTYSGKLESTEKITGTVKVEEFSVEGDFTATRSK